MTGEPVSSGKPLFQTPGLFIRIEEKHLEFENGKAKLTVIFDDPVISMVTSTFEVEGITEELSKKVVDETTRLVDVAREYRDRILESQERIVRVFEGVAKNTGTVITVKKRVLAKMVAKEVGMDTLTHQIDDETEAVYMYAYPDGNTSVYTSDVVVKKLGEHGWEPVIVTVGARSGEEQ